MNKPIFVRLFRLNNTVRHTTVMVGAEILTVTQWTGKGGQEQFSDAESILSQRYVHYVGPSEI